MNKYLKVFTIIGLSFSIFGCTEASDKSKKIEEKKIIESNSQTNASQEYEATPAYAPQSVEEKKKLNNTAKGAIIGAGAGAVSGAIIDKKNRGRGAVVGGILGAGAGAATGHIIDKKKGQ